MALKKKLIGIVVAVVLLFSTPAAASHGTLNCSLPGEIEPLLAFLDTIVQMLLFGGVSLGTLGLTLAGIMVIWPGQDMNRRGKDVAKHVIIGVVILLSAQMVMAFLVSELGSLACA